MSRLIAGWVKPDRRLTFRLSKYETLRMHLSMNRLRQIRLCSNTNNYKYAEHFLCIWDECITLKNDSVKLKNVKLKK